MSFCFLFLRPFLIVAGLPLLVSLCLVVARARVILVCSAAVAFSPCPFFFFANKVRVCVVVPVVQVRLPIKPADFFPPLGCLTAPHVSFFVRRPYRPSGNPSGRVPRPRAHALIASAIHLGDWPGQRAHTYARKKNKRPDASCVCRRTREKRSIHPGPRAPRISLFFFFKIGWALVDWAQGRGQKGRAYDRTCPLAKKVARRALQASQAR